MEEQFCTYDIALKFKELGFNEKCLAWYYLPENAADINDYIFALDNDTPENQIVYIKCPLWQQCFDWFLNKKHLYIDITFKEVKGPKIEGINSVYFDIEIYSISGGDAWKKYRFSEISDDYSYAREQAILKALELISK